MAGIGRRRRRKSCRGWGVERRGSSRSEPRAKARAEEKKPTEGKIAGVKKAKGTENEKAEQVRDRRGRGR